MNYFIQRGDQQYGPYTLGDLQLYVQQGNVSPSDLARSEGMTDWVPVSQVIGNIAVPQPVSPGTGFGAIPGQGAFPAAGTPLAAPTAQNPPPGMHWGVLLLLTIVTCTLFNVVWLFVQATWVKRVRPNSKALAYLLGYVIATAVNVVFSKNESTAAISGLATLAGFVFFIAAAFSMKGDIEDYYNREEPIGLHLSGVMTFFFHGIYFQYHFNRVTDWKRTGVIRPQ